ncbi:hypothetical protein YB2330_000959 [Saitoella coloradoensis]
MPPTTVADAEPRLPKREDFPSSLIAGIVPHPPSSGPLTNLVIFLHGLGDSHLSFARLAHHLQLPETACVSIQGPKAVPMLEEGYWMWTEDIEFGSDGNVSDDGDFTTARTGLHELIKVLTKDKKHGGCGFKPRNVHIFGFGQGGVLGLDVAAQSPVDLGSMISVGGVLPSSTPTPSSKKATKVLICGGDEQSRVTAKEFERVKSMFNQCQRVIWRNHEGDAMPTPSATAEWTPIMAFFGQNLQRIAGIPRDAVEIS